MFAQEYPLSVSLSITFEQSYSGVDGDSASSTELYAVLSSLSGYPIRQGIAVTGSVNQKGRIQSIGGVNEKIEGFFDVCAGRGLTGDQGVMIPAANVNNLMLRKDVVEAVDQGRFHVWQVSTIEQGIEVLTGVPAGQVDEHFQFPPDTVFGAVQAKLKKFHDRSVLKTRSSR
jgi:predicted ATP-dependent protease